MLPAVTDAAFLCYSAVTYAALCNSTVTDAPLCYSAVTDAALCYCSVTDAALCYYAVTDAAITEEVEQLGVDFRNMHDQTYDDAVNMAGKTNGVAAFMHTNITQTKGNVNSHALNVYRKELQSGTALSPPSFHP